MTVIKLDKIADNGNACGLGLEIHVVHAGRLLYFILNSSVQFGKIVPNRMSVLKKKVELCLQT